MPFGEEKQFDPVSTDPFENDVYTRVDMRPGWQAFVDDFRAAFPAAQENLTTYGNFSAAAGEDFAHWQANNSFYTPEPEPGYDALNDPQTKGYEEQAPRYVMSRSRAETAVILKRLNQIQDNNQTISESGWGGFAATLAAGLLDPVNLIPLGRFAVTAKSGRVAAGALEGAAVGAGISAVQDTAASVGQGVPKSGEEFALNMGANALLMAVLGGGSRLLGDVSGHPKIDALRDQLKADFDAALRGTDDIGHGGGPTSGGAAATRGTSLADETPVRSGVLWAEASDSLVGKPGVRTAVSPSLEVRWAARDLAETPIRFEGERNGKRAPLSAETALKQWQGKLATAIEDMDRLFLEYRGKRNTFFGALQTGVRDIPANVRDISRTSAPQVAQPGAMLTKYQFKEQVALAMRRGDQHPIEQVAAAARKYRAVSNELKERAIAAGLLEPEVNVKDTADSHLQRVWDTEKIKARRTMPDGEGFQQRLARHFRQEKADEIARDPAEIDKWRKYAEAAAENLKRVEPLITLSKKGLESAVERLKTLKASRPAAKATDKVLEKQIERLGRELSYASTRAERLTPTGKLAADDPLRQRIEDARALANKKLREPERIVEAIRAKGGVIDTGGDLRASGALPINRKGGIIATKEDGGLSLDVMARELAEEEKWLDPQFDADGAVDDSELVQKLKDAVREDLSADGGNARPVYNEVRDAEQIDRYKAAQETLDEIREAGAKPSMPNEEIAYRMGAIDTYVADTPVKRERGRGAQFYERRVKDNFDRLERDFTKARLEKRAIEDETKAAREFAERARNEIEALRKERAASRRQERHYSGALERRKSLLGVGDDEFDAMAASATDHILGNGQRPLYYPIPVEMAGSLKERVLSVKDIDFEDFLENDVERVMRLHTKSMGADIELADRFGTPDMKDTFDRVRDQYNSLRNTAAARIREREPNITEKALASQMERVNKTLNKRLNQDIEDLTIMRERLQGIAGQPKNPEGFAWRAGRVLRGLNVVIKGGGFLLASIPDIGAVRMLSDSYARMAGPGLAGLVRKTRGVKLLDEEVRAAGVALDMVLHSRLAALTEVGGHFDKHSRFERFVDAAADSSGFINGLSIWTDAMKGMAGRMSTVRTMDAIEAMVGGTIKDIERRRLLWLGIDENIARDMWEQAQRHGFREAGVFAPETAKWTNSELRSIFLGSIAKDVDSTVVTPGIGDRPNWMSTGWGQMIGQFRSYTMSSMTRITMRGLQQADRNVAHAFAMMVTMGMLSYYLKTPPERRSDNLAVVVKEGIDRSGALGWLFEANNMLEKTSGLGISPLLGQPQSQRFYSRSVLGTLGGPSVGLGEDLFIAATRAVQGKMEPQDQKRLARITPYWNLFYFRWLREQFPDEGEGDFR